MQQRTGMASRGKYGLLLAYIAMWLVSPVLQYGAIYRIVAIGVISIFALSALYVSGLRREYGAIMLLIAYVLTISYFTGVSFTKHMGSYIFMICTFFVLYFQSNEGAWKYRNLIVLTYIICIVFNLTTIRALLSDSHVMRYLVRNSENSVQLTKSGIGGYAYCYTVVCLIPFAFSDVLRRSTSFIKKAISVAFLVTAYYMIFSSGYFMAIILSILSIPIYLILRIEDKRKRIVYVGLLIVLTIVVVGSIESIAEKMIRLTDNQLIQRKIAEIVSLATDDSASIEDGEFATRYQRYMKDIQLMFTSPIWGSLGLNNGNHSYILDFFASYGLILGTMYFTAVKKIIESTDIFYSPASQTSVCILFMVLLMNTLAPSFGFVLFIMMPIYSAVEVLEDFNE